MQSKNFVHVFIKPAVYLQTMYAFTYMYIYINIIMYEFMTAAVSGHELNRLRMQRLLNGC